MNPRRLGAIIELQWRLASNQIRRQPAVTRFFSLLALAMALLTSLGSFMGVLTTGSWLLPAEPPWWLVFVWDGLALAFVGAWLWGMITDLQQSESLALDRFLHLPVSPAGVLTLNYLASLLSLSLLMFAPVMMALAAVMALRYGGWFWLTPALVMTFFWMVTAVGWQLKGFLGSLMADPKRKRQLMGAGTLLLIGLVALPSVLDRTVFASANGETSRDAIERRGKELDRQVEAGSLSVEKRDEEIAALRARREAAREARWQWIRGLVVVMNRWCPLGWLPLGVDAAATGAGWQGLLCLAGMGAIGSWSLGRAWRTAVRSQRGDVGRRQARAVHQGGEAVAGPPRDLTHDSAGGSAPGLPLPKPGLATPKSNWIERSWLGLPQVQSAVALGWLRCLSRATEAKVALLWPALVLALITGSAISGQGSGVPLAWRPLTGMGICFFLIMGITQLIQNQFGFDRNGFRAYLLAPLCERDLLLGKNLAVAPVGLALGLIALVGVQFFSPMRISHLIATVFQLGNMLVVACLVSNLMSILTPLAMKPGSLKPLNLKFGIVVLQFLIFALAPLAMLPVLLPLLAEWLLSETPGWNQVPLYLICAAVGLAVFLPLYRIAIGWQADLLHRKRHQILETVTQCDG